MSEQISSKNQGDGSKESHSMSSESEQIKRCAEWLAECLRLGWPKESLDALEALWWKYHGGKAEQQ